MNNGRFVSKSSLALLPLNGQVAKSTTAKLGYFNDETVHYSDLCTIEFEQISGILLGRNFGKFFFKI